MKTEHIVFNITGAEYVGDSETGTLVAINCKQINFDELRDNANRYIANIKDAEELDSGEWEILMQAVMTATADTLSKISFIRQISLK